MKVVRIKTEGRNKEPLKEVESSSMFHYQGKNPPHKQSRINLARNLKYKFITIVVSY